MYVTFSCRNFPTGNQMDHNFANMRVLMQVINLIKHPFIYSFITDIYGENILIRFWMKVCMTTFNKMEIFLIFTFATDGIKIKVTIF